MIEIIQIVLLLLSLYYLKKYYDSENKAKFAQHISNEIEQKVLFLYVENHNDTMFAYKREDSTYITMGKSLQEIVSNSMVSFKDKQYFVILHENEEIVFDKDKILSVSQVK